MGTGRNFDEIIRVIDSLQLTARRKGGACMVVPSVKTEDAPGLFPKGYKVHDVPSGKCYLNHSSARIKNQNQLLQGAERKEMNFFPIHNHETETKHHKYSLVPSVKIKQSNG